MSSTTGCDNKQHLQGHLQITSYLAQTTTNEITYRCVTLPPDGSHLVSLRLKISKAIDKKRLGKAPRHRKWLPNWSTNSSASLLASRIRRTITLPSHYLTHATGQGPWNSCRSRDQSALPLSKPENTPTLTF